MTTKQGTTPLRTHRCGEISLNHVGQEVSLAGWASRIRDLGGVVFIDLRDRWGQVQAVCESGEPLALGKDVKLESVIAVCGTVRPRKRQLFAYETVPTSGRKRMPPRSSTRPRTASSAGVVVTTKAAGS